MKHQILLELKIDVNDVSPRSNEHVSLREIDISQYLSSRELQRSLSYDQFELPCSQHPTKNVCRKAKFQFQQNFSLDYHSDAEESPR